VLALLLVAIDYAAYFLLYGIEQVKRETVDYAVSDVSGSYTSVPTKELFSLQYGYPL
jgi:hypothetical protein